MEDKGRREDSDDIPIYSRLFVVCGKNVTEDDLQSAFTKFGTIEEIRVPRDHSRMSKGIAYVKYSKTSEAAMALEEMHNKNMINSNRPLKVKVACNRTDVLVEDEEDRYRRLFITIPQNVNEDDIQAGFQDYGFIQAIQVQRDRETGQSKGFAYVTFRKFSEAAKAYEECDRKYRAIFAMPKFVRKPQTAFVSNVQSLADPSNCSNSLLSIMNVRPGPFTRVKFMCCPQIPGYNVEMLFNIVPGLVNFHHHVDIYQNYGTGLATYSNPICAAYAVERLNMFEYPPGVKIFVKPDLSNCDKHDNFMNLPRAVNRLQRAINSASKSTNPDLAQLAQAIAEASKLIKSATAGIGDNIPDSSDMNYCSVQLPPPKPLADINAPKVKRCFLVCKPQPPPLTVLRDIFCRFGDLINVYTLPNKTIGYANYASADAADKAISVLHGAEICGIRIKVIEAEEEAPPKRVKYD